MKFLHKISTILLLTLFFPASGLAAEYLVSPLALNLDLESRDIIKETIVLINNSDRPVRLYAGVNEVAITGDGVLESFKAPSMVDRTNTPTSWVEVTRSRIELKPNERREIPLTIRMNPNTEPGRYSVFVGFASASNQPNANKKILAGDAPGTLINLSIDKEQNQFLRLSQFIIDRFVTETASSSFSYTLENPSGAQAIPKGEIIFYDSKGIEVAAQTLNDENLKLSPDETKTFFATLPAELSLGKYKALLSVEYGDNLTASIQDTAFFYVTPLPVLIIIFLFILSIAMLLTYYLHRRLQPAEMSDFQPLDFYLSDTQSPDQHHDINLKTNNDKT